MFYVFCYLRQFGERVTSLKKPSLPDTQAEIRDFVRGGGGDTEIPTLCRPGSYSLNPSCPLLVEWPW